VFGVEAGKFLGLLLTERGIKANPEKCVAIIAMRSPISVKEVQVEAIHHNSYSPQYLAIHHNS